MTAARRGPLFGSVYFVQPLGGGPIKIGLARDAQQRIRQLQSLSPFPLRTVAILPGKGPQAEVAIHRRFASDRLHGEWFAPTPALLAFIAEQQEQVA